MNGMRNPAATRTIAASATGALDPAPLRVVIDPCIAAGYRQ